MNVLIVLVLIHASMGTVVKFNFVPPKAYELEVNQTRTNMKLKVGRNGDGHVIENILKPLFEGSGQVGNVGVVESDKKCTDESCKEKCIKRKKMCLKGGLVCEEVQTSDEACNDSTTVPDEDVSSFHTGSDFLTGSDNTGSDFLTGSDHTGSDFYTGWAFPTSPGFHTESDFHTVSDFDTAPAFFTEETPINPTAQERETTPDFWGSYFDGEVSSDQKTANYLAGGHVLHENQDLISTGATNAKQNKAVDIVLTNGIVSEENNQRVNQENVSRSSDPKYPFSFPALFNLMKQKHDPLSKLFLKTESPSTDHSAVKSKKNLTEEESALHEPQLIFSIEASHIQHPSSLKHEQSVVSLVRKVSPKNKSRFVDVSKNTQNAPSRNEKPRSRKDNEETNQSKDSDASDHAKRNGTATLNPDDSNLTTDSVKKNDLTESKSTVSTEKRTEGSKNSQTSAAEHIEQMNFADNDDVLEVDKTHGGESKSTVSTGKRTEAPKKSQTSAAVHIEQMNFADDDDVVEVDQNVQKWMAKDAKQNKSTVASHNTDSKKSETSADDKDLVIIGEDKDGKIVLENQVVKYEKQEEKKNEDKTGSKKKESTDTRLSEESDTSYQGVINNIDTQNLVRREKPDSNKSDAKNLQNDQETKANQPQQEIQSKREQANDSNNVDVSPNLEEDNADEDEDDGDDIKDEQEDHGGEEEADDEGKDEEDDDASDGNQLPKDDGPNKNSKNKTESPKENRKQDEKKEEDNNIHGNNGAEDSNPTSEELHKRHGVENDCPQSPK